MSNEARATPDSNFIMKSPKLEQPASLRSGRLVRLAKRLAKRLDAIGETLDEHDLMLMSGHSTNSALILQRGSGKVLATLEGQGPWGGGDPFYQDHPDGGVFTKDVDDYDPNFSPNAGYEPRDCGEKLKP